MLGEPLSLIRDLRELPVQLCKLLLGPFDIDA
jgi:hypothetical protein